MQSLSGRESVSLCELKLRLAGMNMDGCACDVISKWSSPLLVWDFERTLYSSPLYTFL